MRAYAPFLSLLLGAAAATGFAPLELWPVTLLCIAAWLWLVHRAPTITAALWRGWLFGLGHFTVNDNWIQHAFTYQDKMPHWLGYGAAVGLALYLAIYTAIPAGLAWRYTQLTGRDRPAGADYALAAGAAWIVGEWLRAEMFTGYAWDPLAVIWVPVLPIARSAAWMGTYALSGVTVAIAGALMLLALRRWRLAAVGAALIGATALTAPPPLTDTSATKRVRVVQPNIGQEQREDEDFGEKTFARLIDLTGYPEPGAPPRLILWPEGAVRYFLEEGYPLRYYWRGSPSITRARIAAILGRHDILLTGTDALQFDAAGNIATSANSIFAIDSHARLLGRYDKAHLVPYGEYLPMRSLLEPLGLARLVPGDIDFKPGPGPADLALPDFGNIGAQICYEIVFSGEVVDEAQRPRVLFNPSNDSWFGSWGPPQHLAQARMRAIEEGLPILRATPTGISAVIAADGHLLGTVPAHRAGVIDLPFPPALPATIFARMGNWMAAIVAALLLGLAVVIGRRAR